VAEEPPLLLPRQLLVHPLVLPLGQPAPPPIAAGWVLAAANATQQTGK
jgi:hypothetical protein